MPRKFQTAGMATMTQPAMVPSASPYDAATLAWIAAVFAVNGTVVSATQAGYVDTLIVGLKADGLWTKLDRLWLHATENSTEALVDIVGDVLATAVNSPSFSANRGFTGVNAGTTVYIDTNTNLSTLGGNYTRIAAHISAWSNTEANASGAGGGVNGMSIAGGTTNSTGLIPRYGGSAYFRINDNSPSAGFVNASSVGHFIASRPSDPVSNGYINGSLFGTPNKNTAPMPNENMVILAVNDTTIGVSFGGAYQICMTSLGGSLDGGTDASKFYTRLRTYMSSVGVP